MFDKAIYKETFSALHASGDTLEEVYKVIEKKERHAYLKRVIVVAAVLALILAFGAMAYASNWFGIRALVRPDTFEMDDVTYNWISLAQPQGVPDDVAPSVAVEISNSEAAWAEWMEYKETSAIIPPTPEVFKNAPENYRISKISDHGDGTYSAVFHRLTEEGENLLEEVIISAEEYEEIMSYYAVMYPPDYEGYDFHYGVKSAQEAEKLEEIAAKYGLNVRHEINLVWSSGTAAMTGKQFFTNQELAEMTAEIGCAGNIFYETPAGFDKVYWFDEGTFCVSYSVNLPSSGELISCYGYNSMYSTLSSGKEVLNWESDIEGFTERKYTATDGTELTILTSGNGESAYIYVYLENSFFAEHIYGAQSMTDADLDYIADYLNYSLIGKK